MLEGMPNLWTSVDYRVFLREWLESERTVRPAVSLRWMAQRLAMDASLLSKILAQERHLSHSRVQPVIDLLTRVIPIDNILFASEMIGAVRGIDPQTGYHFDDTKRYIEAAHVDPAQRKMIYEGNARRVYPRLDAALNARGR